MLGGQLPLVAANRTTITACLNELKKQGYVWTEGRRLIVLPPGHMIVLDGLERAVLEGDEEDALAWAEKAVELKVDPLKALDALSSGMRQTDRRYARNEIGLPDIVLSAYAMKGGLHLLDQEIQPESATRKPLGTIVIGTVFRDIHDRKNHHCHAAQVKGVSRDRSWRECFKPAFH